jgi:CheY-like chemotaxis protein
MSVGSNAERRPRVILADDESSVLIALARLLTPSCDIVASVPNGHAAIDAVTRLRPDVLVIDFILPDVDGLTVCQHVRQTAPEIDVIIVSGAEDALVRTAALERCSSAFVPKHDVHSSLEDVVLRIFAKREESRSEL